jgi:hypothetical protein
MSALIEVLFAAAALLALAAMAASAKRYGAAWLAMARQFERGRLERGSDVPRKHLAHARRLKQPPARRARARARQAARAPRLDARPDARIAARTAATTGKSVHNRFPGLGMAFRSDTLMPE